MKIEADINTRKRNAGFWVHVTLLEAGTMGFDIAATLVESRRLVDHTFVELKKTRVEFRVRDTAVVARFWVVMEPDQDMVNLKHIEGVYYEARALLEKQVNEIRDLRDKLKVIEEVGKRDLL